MKPSKCLNCGSSELFFHEGYFQNETAHIFGGLTNAFHNTVVAEVYVCGECGHVMFFMGAKDLEDVKKKWQRAN